MKDAHTPLAADGRPRQNALDVLLQRMQDESDFPALSEAIGAINRIASSDREGVNELSNNILKDFALSTKLLKLVNVAYYSQVGGGSISTISRAVVVLGFDAVRSIALSLILLDNLENKGHAQLLKEEFVKVLYAGMLARELAPRAQVKDVEEAFIGAMMHNLGRLLSMFYFPRETAAIGQLVEAAKMDDERASAQVLGLSFESLGTGVARHWGFPDQLVQSMKRLPAGRLRKNAALGEKLRLLAGFSNELCDAILNTPDADRTKALAALATRFGDGLALTEKDIARVLEDSMQDINQFALAVNVNLKQSQFAERAAKWAGVSREMDELEAQEADSVKALDDSVLHERPAIQDEPSGEPGASAKRSSQDIQAVLTSGLQDVSNSLIDDSVSLNDVLRMILETMFVAMGFANVVLCIKDSRRNVMHGKLGFGEDVQALISSFDFSLAGKPDVFLVALQNNADILIADIDEPKIASRVPGWYRQHVTARTFVLFPIVVKGKPIGLIYADHPDPGGIDIPEMELSLLKSLRNQAVLAIRQSL